MTLALVLNQNTQPTGGDISTPLNRVRLEIQDTDPDAPLFYDDQILLKLADRDGNVLLAAADLCDMLAIRYARDFDFSEDGQSVKRMGRSTMFADLAASLRRRAQNEAGATTGAAGAPWHPNTGCSSFRRQQFDNVRS